MEKTMTAILIRATDKGESDKLVRLFSVQDGIVTATLRGVRKKNAKLKFAAQPFSVCEYEAAQKNGRLLITGATQIEDMYELCTDAEKYAAASVAIEVVDKAAVSIDSSELFVYLLKTLKALLSSENNSAIIVAKFVQKIISVSGFAEIKINRVDSPATASELLDYIAYKTMDETSRLIFNEQLSLNALRIILRKFEKIYEVKLKSSEIFFSLT